jgi:hypothetical protein
VQFHHLVADGEFALPQVGQFVVLLEVELASFEGVELERLLLIKRQAADDLEECEIRDGVLGNRQFP